MINWIALIVALALSSVAAYYSILGLTTLFSSAYWPIVIMGSVLELSKIVTASWLYRNWRYCPILLKGYLTAAVLILCFITSMGIFGFLSKAHIEQTLAINTGSKGQIEVVDTKIQIQQEALNDIDQQLKLIDSAIGNLIKRNRSTSALREVRRQKKAKDILIKQKQEKLQEISKLKVERIKYQSETKKLEAELGPLKYVAELVYDKVESTQIEKAVRWVIILIVLVFDPLAILLLIAANVGLRKKHLTKFEDDHNIKIDPNSVVHID